MVALSYVLIMWGNMWVIICKVFNNNSSTYSPYHLKFFDSNELPNGLNELCQFEIGQGESRGWGIISKPVNQRLNK